MNDSQPRYEPTSAPPPPTPRPAAGIAALVLLLIVFVAGVGVGQSGLFASGAAANAPRTPQPALSPVPPTSGAESPVAQPRAPANFDLFWQALEVVRTNFVGREDLDENELTYGAIRGMIEALGDTGHSVFLTPQEVQSEQNALDGSVVGIGVLLGERDDGSVIVSVVPNSPAQRAGIKAGDQIVAVDGQDVEGLSPDEAAARVRGEEGSTVVVTIQRPSTGERLDFSIVREEIRIPSASWAMVPGTTVGLLRLAQFSAGSADELRVARDTVVNAGATSLILDLRGNPGGYVDEAVRSASLFMRDRVVYIRELASGERIPVETNDEVTSTDLPLVVLIDANSASSAEILAGAIKSAERAPLVGVTTFGTGTVLLPHPLADGSSIRLAVERWLTPDGELIFDRGITPTEEVELGPEDVPIEPDELRELGPDALSEITDTQLLRAMQLAGVDVPLRSGSPPASWSPPASGSPPASSTPGASPAP